MIESSWVGDAAEYRGPSPQPGAWMLFTAAQRDSACGDCVESVCGRRGDRRPAALANVSSYNCRSEG